MLSNLEPDPLVADGPQFPLSNRISPARVLPGLYILWTVPCKSSNLALALLVQLAICSLYLAIDIVNIAPALV